MNIGYIETCLENIDKHARHAHESIDSHKTISLSMYYDYCTAIRNEVKLALVNINDENSVTNRCERLGCFNLPEELHPCPYNQDITGNNEPICTCCVDCQNRCCEDI